MRLKNANGLVIEYVQVSARPHLRLMRICQEFKTYLWGLKVNQAHF